MIRYREDVGWERRCEDCFRAGHGTAYWPLLPLGEFWSTRTYVRCVACQKERRRRNDRIRHGSLPARVKGDRRARDAARSRVYYYRNRARVLARAKARYQANRERLLAERRDRYWARKAA